jgi:hypothetical protein
VTPAATPPAAPPKPSWPLLVLAGLSFIPGFGFLFGAGAVTWGLLSKRRHSRLAIILGGIGCLLTVAEGFVLVKFVSERPEFAEARVELTRLDLATVVTAIEDYRARTGAYPRELQALVTRARLPMVNVIDRSASLLSQRTYQYVPARDGGYDLFAVGVDGVAGTADDVRPALSDSLLQASGYRPAPPVR